MQIKDEESEDNEISELSDNIETYCVESYNRECIELQSFAPNWYRDIKSKKDIERIIQG